MPVVPNNNNASKEDGSPTNGGGDGWRHFETEFSECDAAWLVLDRWHVQTFSRLIPLVSAGLGLALALCALLLVRPPLLLWVCLGVLILLPLLSLPLGLAGLLTRNRVLLFLFASFLWAFAVLWFSLLFFLLPMLLAAPPFWRGWMRTIFGIQGQLAVRLVTLFGLLVSLGLLCLFTFFYATILRTRNFLVAKGITQRKGKSNNAVPPEQVKRQKSDGNDGRQKEQKQVQMMETVA